MYAIAGRDTRIFWIDHSSSRDQLKCKKTHQKTQNELISTVALSHEARWPSSTTCALAHFFLSSFNGLHVPGRGTVRQPTMALAVVRAPCGDDAPGSGCKALSSVRGCRWWRYLVALSCVDTASKCKLRGKLRLRQSIAVIPDPSDDRTALSM